jgi:hypothetical protein
MHLSRGYVVTEAMKRNAVTLPVNATVYIFTTFAIINSIAVADVQAQLGAVPPDGVLDEPGEGGGKVRVEGAGIHTLDDRLQDPRAAGPLVADWTVPMAGIEAVQDAGPVQEIVHQGVDHDHAAAHFGPALAAAPGAQQQAGKGHAQHLV